MAQWLATRLVGSAAVLLAVSLLTFFLLQLAPGDPVLLMLGSDATVETIAETRTRLGLDQPLPAQYIAFIGNLLHGDLGRSFVTHDLITEDLARTLPASLELTCSAMALAVVIGMPLGMTAGRSPGSALDRLITGGSALALSIPVYCVGLVLIYFFAVVWRVLPTSGYGDLNHLVMPAVTLAIFSAGSLARITRGAIADVRSLAFVRTAAAKGLSQGAILRGHMLRNALIPIVTVFGLQFGLVFGGSVLTETVFAWPGLGRLLLTAVLARDYPLIRGCILALAAVFVFVNIVVDVAYFTLDPRLERR